MEERIITAIYRSHRALRCENRKKRFDRKARTNGSLDYVLSRMALDLKAQRLKVIEMTSLGTGILELDLPHFIPCKMYVT